MFNVVVDYMQGYGETFPDLDSALTYAVDEVKKDSDAAVAHETEPGIDAVTVEDEETGAIYNLVEDNGWRWELED